MLTRMLPGVGYAGEIVFLRSVPTSHYLVWWFTVCVRVRNIVMVMVSVRVWVTVSKLLGST